MKREVKNQGNLIPLNQRSKEAQRVIQQMGRDANKEKCRRKMTIREVSQAVLSGKNPITSIDKLLADMGVPLNERNVQAAIIAGQSVSGMKGNEKAARLVMEYAGVKPEEDDGKDEKPFQGIPASILGGQFCVPYQDMLERKYSDYDFQGGRGSLKSSACGLFVIDQIERHKAFCGLAVRQLKDNLHDSVYSQITWSIDMLGLQDDYKCTKNPMLITKISTGQKIYFRGGDDPKKIKSIKPPMGMHIGVVWIEEADQLRGEDALRDIKQSAFRGGDNGILLRSYNVPRSQLHFINKEKLIPNPRRLVHHSHFKHARREWLGERFYEDAEHLKATNLTAYEHEYDGLAVGFGANVFENIEIREITDAEISAFDRCYYGIDWGWYPDPWHFCECCFHMGSRTLYIFGELRYNRRSNAALADDIEKWKTCRITADSGGEGMKSIADFFDRGFDMRPAIKGPGSVDYSMKWLSSLSKIVIDNARCPETAQEFINYEFERDRDGHILTGYPDKENHAIDAVRYALEEVWKRRGQ